MYPALLNRTKVFFLLDNGRPHVAKKTHDKLAEMQWQIMYHPLYSLDNQMRHKNLKKESDVKEEVSKYFSSKKVFLKNRIHKLLNR